MPNLVASTSALARKPCVRTHYVRTNNSKFSGHYVYPRTETVRAHALRSHQLFVTFKSTNIINLRIVIQFRTVLEVETAQYIIKNAEGYNSPPHMENRVNSIYSVINIEWTKVNDY